MLLKLIEKKLWKSFFWFLVKCSTLVPGRRGVRLSRQWIRLANLAIGTMCFFILQGLSCSKSSANGFPARSNPKNAFLKRATEIDRKKCYENHFFGFWYAPLWSLVPADKPLANLAIGNMCFFILQRLSCSKSPPNGLPARSSTKNAFLNRAVLLKLIGKKGYENHFLVSW